MTDLEQSKMEFFASALAVMVQRAGGELYINLEEMEGALPFAFRANLESNNAEFIIINDKENYN